MTIAIALAAFAHAATDSADYLASCLATRTTSRVGSWYEGVEAAELHAKLLAAAWEEYSHPAIKSPALGFRAPIGGKLGIIHLDDLPNDVEIQLLDPKGGEEFWSGERSVAPCVSASKYGIETPNIDFTTLLVGPASHEIDAPFTLWTFHPGAPVRPSEVNRVANGVDLHGKSVTIAEAKALGFDFVKLTK